LYAVNGDGIQQEGVITYGFSISKPWWSSWWFYLLLNLLVLSVILLIVRNHINQRLKLELIRSNISNDLHDDIGATLSSVNFYIDLAQSEKDNADYLRFIKENVNHVITNLDDLVWSINPRNDTTEQFINRMKDYAVPLLKAACIQCQFQLDSRLMDLKLDLPTKQNLYLMFKEMINNVAKHARGHNCIIELVHRNGKLELKVTDDGQGFDPLAVNPARNGLLSMRERTRKLNGEIKIISAPKNGSSVAVSIPL
jgi:signal transduction histidine kinase